MQICNTCHAVVDGEQNLKLVENQEFFDERAVSFSQLN